MDDIEDKIQSILNNILDEEEWLNSHQIVDKLTYNKEFGNNFLKLKTTIESHEKLKEKYIKDLNFTENYELYRDQKLHVNFPVQRTERKILCKIGDKEVDLGSSIIRKISSTDKWDLGPEYHIEKYGRKISETSNCENLETNLFTMDNWELTDSLKEIENYGINSRFLYDFIYQGVKLIFEYPLKQALTLVVTEFNIIKAQKNKNGIYTWKNSL